MTNTALNVMTDAFNKQRKEWYGQLWQAVDWWGIPDRAMPENQRQDIIKHLKERWYD